MPERYDRAFCVTELRLRDDILSKIAAEGWRPSVSYAAPPKVPMKGELTPTQGAPDSQASELPDGKVDGGHLVESEVDSTSPDDDIDVADLGFV